MTGRRREPLPEPDLSGTDPNEILRSRVNLNIPVNPPPPLPAHTQVDTGTKRVRAGRGGTRPDPEGMRRASIYVSQEAAQALERAADHVVEVLGGDTPRHVALSALLLAAADQVGPVTQKLARARAAELAERLAALPPIPE